MFYYCYQNLCTVIGVVLHYLFLVAVCWLLCECVLIFILIQGYRKSGVFLSIYFYAVIAWCKYNNAQFMLIHTYVIWCTSFYKFMFLTIPLLQSMIVQYVYMNTYTYVTRSGKIDHVCVRIQDNFHTHVLSRYFDRITICRQPALLFQMAFHAPIEL